jgi:hypothetical protein
MQQNGSSLSKVEEMLVFERFNKRASQDKLTYAELIEDMTPRTAML